MGMEAGGGPAPGVVVAPALVRFLDADGLGQGLGLLVADREIVTCAHVVNLALGLDREYEPRPDIPVQLDFPFVAPGRRYTAAVVAWQAPADDGTGDVAGLRLYGTPPGGVVPCSLATTADDLHGHRCHVFGFTPAHTTGVWVSGELRGPDLAGNVQISGDPAGGARLTPGFSGAPVWDEQLQAVVGIVSRATIGRTPSGGYCVPAELIAAAWPEIESRTRPPCPYRGLLPMREADAGSFFGRDQVSERLATLLPRGRLSLLVGPSGCGKSSVLRAGVLPRLQGRGDLSTAVCRPGAVPFAALASAIAELSTGEGVDGTGPEAGLLERLLEQAGRERVFLVVDQFEELLAHPQEVVAEFISRVSDLAAASRPDGRPLCCVVLVARSDFAAEITGITALMEALALGRTDAGEGVHTLLPMTADELRQAVERPVERLRVVRYEEGLVDRLMRDVRRLDNPLAPLAFTLTQLWEYQRAGRIPLAAYEDLGEVAGALRTHFDRVYDEELGADDQTIARLLLLRLTARDGRGRHVRRPVRRDELDPRFWDVAQRLAGRRMVTLLNEPDGSELVELAHDALFEEWPRLHDWLSEESEFLDWHHRFRVAVESWTAADETSRRLLDQTDLAEAQAAVQRWRDRLMAHELAFIERSEVHQRKVRRVLHGVWIVGVLLVCAVTAAVTMVFVVNDRARDAEDARLSHDLAVGALTGDVWSGLPQALAAYERSPTPQARYTLASWYQRMALVEEVRTGDMSTVAGPQQISPDGRYVLGSWGSDGAAMLWDLERAATPDVPIAAGQAGQRTGHAFTPDSRQVVFGENNDIVFWDIASRSATKRLPVAADGNENVHSIIHSIRVAPSGELLAFARNDAVHVVDARTGRVRAGPLPVQPIPDNRAGFELRFDAQSRLLSVVGTERDWTLDLRTGRQSDGTTGTDPHTGDAPTCVPTLAPTGRTRGAVNLTVGGRTLIKDLTGTCEDYTWEVDVRTDELVVLSDLARTALVPQRGNELDVYSMRDGRLLARFQVPDGWRATVAPDERGARVVLHASNGYLLLRLPPPDTLPRALSIAESAAITPDGNHVATLIDNALALWDARTGQRRQVVIDDRLRETPDGTFWDGTVIVSPDGSTFAAYRNGAVGYVQTIAVAAPHPTVGWQLDERDGWYRGWAGSADQATPVSASFVDGQRLLVRAGNRISRWDPGTGDRLGQAMSLPAAEYGDWAARPGHAQLMTAPRASRSVELWDVDTARVLRRFDLDEGGEGNVVFSRDGSRALAKRTGATAAVLDVDEGGTMARMPRSGELKLADGTSTWESDYASPAALLGDGEALLDHATGGYLRWTWPDRRVPLLSKGEVTHVPAPDGLTGRPATVDHTRRIVLYSAGRHGWRLLPMNPDRWRDTLCTTAAEARLNTVRDGRQSCPGR